MSNTRRRLAWIGPATALIVLVQLFHGAPPARAAESSTTTTTTAAPTSTTTGPASSTTGPTSTTAGPTSATAGPTTSTTPGTPDCEAVLAGDQQGSLGKSRADGGNEQLSFDVFRLRTGRSTGVYHVVDCIRVSQDAPNPAVVVTVDLGEIEISGSVAIKVDIPGNAIPGEDVCDRFVLTGEAGGVPFTDISNEVCAIYSGCLGFGPGTCPPAPPTTGGGGVAPTSPSGGTLPLTGSSTWPLLLTAVVLLGLGGAVLAAARWRDRRTTF